MQKKKLRLIGLAILAGFSVIFAWITFDQSKHREVFKVGRIVFSPDGHLLALSATINQTSRVAVFDAATKKQAAELDPNPHAWAFRFSADGTTLITWAKDAVLYWDTRTWKVTKQFKLTALPDVHSINLMPDEKTLVFLRGHAPESITVWDAWKDGEIFSIPLLGNSLYKTAISPDGKLLALTPMDYPTGKVVGLARRKIVFDFISEPRGKFSWWTSFIAAFSPDSTALAVGDGYSSEEQLAEYVISIWDLRNNKRQKMLRGQKYGFTSLAFSPDGRLLASGSGVIPHRGELKVWSLSDEKELFSLTVHSPVHCVAFSPNGKTLAYGMSGKIGGFEFVNVDDLYKAEK